MSEMTAAQGYQDLTGQIIRRVVDLVRAVHAGLGEVADGSATPLHLNNTHASSRGFGPSVAGVDPAPATQDDFKSLFVPNAAGAAYLPMVEWVRDAEHKMRQHGLLK